MVPSLCLWRPPDPNAVSTNPTSLGTSIAGHHGGAPLRQLQSNHYQCSPPCSLLWNLSLLVAAIDIISGRFAFGLPLQAAVSGGPFLGRWAKNPMGRAIHLAHSR
jgi:hypothetical protein